MAYYMPTVNMASPNTPPVSKVTSVLRGVCVYIYIHTHTHTHIYIYIDVPYLHVSVISVISRWRNYNKSI